MADLTAEKLLSPENLKLLNELPEPKTMWKYFLWCTQIPRGSGNLKAITEALLELGKKLGVEGETDKIGNVRLRKHAAPGHEGHPGLILQAHMDMVCSKRPDVAFDFVKEPIHVRKDGEFLKATGTTLGADNGIGIGAALAILEDPTPKGMIEVLLTKDEETDMSGAENLSGAPFLLGKTLINCDSEEEGAICVGSAGGFRNVYKIPMERVPMGGDLVGLRLAIKGLRGGHTGVDIHHGRANALKLLVRLLLRAGEESKAKVHLRSFNGGEVANSIPRDAEAKVAVEKSLEGAFRAALKAELAHIEDEFKRLENANAERLTVEATTETGPVCSPASTQRALDFLLCLPHGVTRMSPEVDGLVESSTSVSILKFSVDEPAMTLTTFSRSSVNSQMDAMNLQWTSLARLAGVQNSGKTSAFPGWAPNMSSPVLAVLKGVYQKEFGKDPRVYAIHAGLECGMIQGHYPGMDCVSIGPNIHNPHTPDEDLDVPSVTKFWKLLAGTVAKLS